MDKQTTIAFILIGVILVVWLYMNAPEPVPPAQQSTDSTLVQENVPQKTDTVVSQPTPSPIEPSTSETEFQENITFPSAKSEPNVISIETDLVKLEMNNIGARFRKYYLKEYKTWYFREIEDENNFYDKHVQLVNPVEDGDFNLIFVTNDGSLINTKNLDFKLVTKPLNYKISGGDSLKLSYEYTSPQGNIIRKNYTFYGNDYRTKFEVELINMNEIISSYRYDVVWSNGLNFTEENSVEEANFSKASAYSGDEEVIVDASSVGEKVKKDINGKVDWVGVKTKYFTVIITPEEPNDEGGAYFEGEHIQNKYGDREIYSASLKVPFENLNYQKNKFDIYFGPLEYGVLKSYDKNYQAIYDFGSFFGMSFVTRPISEFILLPLFNFLHLFIPNYGFVIVIFSIIIKLALYPLTKQSYKSMRRMQQLQPKIAEIKAKHKDDPQKVQKETMKLYSTYGINPAGGCLPMLLQMPILFALFTFFNVAIDIRNEPFMFWITNLSSPDVIFTLPSKIPIFGISTITGLAPLLGITMFLQQKMSVKDPSQKALVYIMPIMFTLMFMNFTSGLNLYYFMFNLLSIGQQYYINHKKGDEELVPVKNPKKKGGFMSKMMEAAEKQQQAQRKASKKKGR